MSPVFRKLRDCVKASAWGQHSPFHRSASRPVSSGYGPGKCHACTIMLTLNLHLGGSESSVGKEISLNIIIHINRRISLRSGRVNACNKYKMKQLYYYNEPVTVLFTDQAQHIISLPRHLLAGGKYEV